MGPPNFRLKLMAQFFVSEKASILRVYRWNIKENDRTLTQL